MNSKFVNGRRKFSGRQSVFTRLNFGARISAQHIFSINSAKPSILGPPPSGLSVTCSRCLAHNHVSAPRCSLCFRWGHFSSNCKFAPRLARPSMDHSRIDPALLPDCSSMTGGPIHPPRRFVSFGDFFKHFTGITPPTPFTVHWSPSWRITAPEFVDEDEDASPSLASPTSLAPPSLVSDRPRRFASFGEFASEVLGIPSPKRIVHVLWTEKTPISTVHPLSHQHPMAFWLIDPEPFMPLGAQRRVVHGRPVMRRVVIGHVAQRNNDLAIACLQPMPQGPINFMAIHNIIADFLRDREIGFRSMQPCPFGQAYVRFNYIFERDLLVEMGPIPYGNGSISFVPHNQAWNNRTSI